jgi:hypothetical protein
MYGLIEAVRAWQLQQQGHIKKAYFSYFKPKEVNLKLEAICLHCQSQILPGERHPGCDSHFAIDKQYQCIVCLNDERIGDHAKCREEISKVRSFLGIKG